MLAQCKSELSEMEWMPAHGVAAAGSALPECGVLSCFAGIEEMRERAQSSVWATRVAELLREDERSNREEMSNDYQLDEA